MKRMILIVDDEERVLFVLQNALMKLEDSFEVVTAATAEDGLRKAKDVAFDLVITDLIMPDMDGMEFTERIIDQRSNLAVVWMTAYGCKSFEDEAERLGVYRCLEKPVEIGEFREIARRALAASRENGDGASGGDGTSSGR